MSGKNEIVKIGNTSFNLDHVKTMTEKQFKKQFAGKLSYDIDKAWKQLNRAVKKLKD